MIGVLWWIVGHWWLVVVLGAVVVAWRVGGWRLALVVATLGLGWRIYAAGRRRGREEIERRDQDRRDHLEEQYDEISNSPLDPGDAYERLRHRSRDE